MTTSSTRFVTTKGTHGTFSDVKVGSLAAATGKDTQGAYVAVGVAAGTTSVSGLPRG